jgi:NADH:ubiquinone oxidoreductase subunit H
MLRLSLLILPQVLALIAVVLYAWANGYHRRFLGMSKRLPGPARVFPPNNLRCVADLFK